MSEQLHTCPVCHIPNFTKDGLKRHKCKGGTRMNHETGLVEVVKPMSDPAWEVMAPAPAALSPAALVANINDHHARAQNDAAHAKAYADSAVQAAILAGLQLVELKTATPHGKWDGMFTSAAKRVGKANVAHVQHLDFSYDTARRYIAVATQLVSAKLRPEQSAVLMELARGGPMTPAAADLLREITPDKSLRRTYLELGIVKPTAKELASMASLEDADNRTPDPAPPADETLADRYQRMRIQARTEWFGSASPGMLGHSGVLPQILSELNHPADGLLPYLRPEDLTVLATDCRRLSAYCSKLAKESTK